jgi:hypothetical protein
MELNMHPPQHKHRSMNGLATGSVSAAGALQACNTSCWASTHAQASQDSVQTVGAPVVVRCCASPFSKIVPSKGRLVRGKGWQTRDTSCAAELGSKDTAPVQAGATL